MSCHPFKLTWRLNLPLKVGFLCWQLVQKVIPSAEFLISRGMAVNNTCSLCKLHVEKALHIFFKWDFARGVWFGLNLSSVVSRMEHTDIKEGFCTIINELGKLTNYEEWLSMYGAGLWQVWKARNVARFENKQVSARHSLFSFLLLFQCGNVCNKNQIQFIHITKTFLTLGPKYHRSIGLS
ncbi:hypothetical protein FRX31_028732 [Thalictrum thalictroides]|uniref:Reverse transcriptase zinc-binding domain-containing protein n=1 Tax=Thalictrum thalictroides TaxID=46969 RepID=A0A7J6VAN7_THATH|nr:hypothetical protein FRX31_028732 [Thalictrum thalictroides]